MHQDTKVTGKSIRCKPDVHIHWAKIMEQIDTTRPFTLWYNFTNCQQIISIKYGKKIGEPYALESK